MKHFAAWCGQEKENFTGSWDLGHQLQIVFGKVMKNNPEITKFNKHMYAVMSDHKSHLAGIRFKEIAEDLEYAVLTNKGIQETRWVRAELRSLQTYLRNIPTLAAIYSKEVEDCAKNLDITNQRIAEKLLNRITEPKDISFAIGLCQILEEYSSLSISAQDILTSPSEVPGLVRKLEKTLEDSKV